MISPGRYGGRRRSRKVREVLNGIFYVLRTGCQWRIYPTPYALEADWPVGAAGFEPLHIRIGIRQDSQPGGRNSSLRLSN
jgi:hypothetical protein